ncbi:MAG TPA: amidohydrolase [Steroidobacteraceae bacterium]|nr:amidohydrolase [Steroidobacteraceae bacterium]
MPRTAASGVLLLMLGAGVAGAEPELPPELIVSGGQVRTPGGWAQALAVRDGVLIAVGERAPIEALRGPGTHMLSLAGATVLPGLHDVHVHPMYAGIMAGRCRIAQGATLVQLQDGVRACAHQGSASDWIVGGQWDTPALGRAPDRSALDAVTQVRPVYLEDTSGHSAWVNTRALQIAGITRSSADPPGGIIERDAAGEPTGILRESATDLVRTHIPPPTVAMLRAALLSSLHTMLREGITSYTEAAVGFVAGPKRELAAYRELSRAGLIKPRARLCITWTPGDAESARAIALRNLNAGPRVSPDCVKIFLDGVPTDSHTAAMLAPYVASDGTRSDEAARTGLLLVKQDELDAAVTRFDRMGLTVKFHAAGDAAVRAGLNAIAAARRANGFSAQVHNVGHCTFVDPKDLGRARELGAAFEVSPYLWGPSPINDSIAAAVGPERIARVWPVREMLAAGALVVPGSDWSVVPSVSPWIGIETLVTRERPGGSSDSFGKGEAISVAEALELFTANAARQEHAANRVGRLEAGMLADFIVIDRDPYAIAPTELHATQVRMTFINGEKVYERDPGAAGK